VGALAFEGVCCSLSGACIVDDLHLTLESGRILTLLGPSGSGKTTMLRLAVGLERCTRGRILHGERVVDDPAKRIFVPTERRDVGMVFQSYALWPHMTVFENVAFPLVIRKRAAVEVRDKVHEALTLVGLQNEAGRGATRLSGGQQQRVAIARALISQPAVLFADEPFSNLDAQLREQMRVDLKALQRRLRFSVLFVTHDQSEALALSDALAIVRDGKLEQVGSPQDIYARPKTAFVRDFIGRWLRVKCRFVSSEAGIVAVTTGDGSDFLVEGADWSQGARHDGKCLLVIRPEDVVVRRVGAAGSDLSGNMLPATIETLLFLGQSFEAAVRLGDGERVLILLPAGQSWTEGEPILLHLPPAKAHLWPRT
jgi:ABC-type Fe3+/spermidine/putrescine transport system ATPase subunit